MALASPWLWSLLVPYYEFERSCMIYIVLLHKRLLCSYIAPKVRYAALSPV